jgi:hypothetical protein
VLASVTLSAYRARLAPALAGLPAGQADGARSGLAQAVAAGGQGPLGTAARHAFAAGLDLGMAAGAACVAVAAVTVAVALGRRPAVPASPDPALTSTRVPPGDHPSHVSEEAQA